MGKKDPRIDAYINDAGDFAKPILIHIRKLMHRGCPELEETMKWSFPHFDYKGMFASMAAFKQHAVLGFWKGSRMSTLQALKKSEASMGHFGRIRSLQDLPSDRMILAAIAEARKLNDLGVKVSTRTHRPKPKPVRVPPFIRKALQKDKKAMGTFAAFSPSHKREYVEWITEAKSDDTRTRRLTQAVAWMAEGKPRNWRYVKRK